MYIRHTRLTKKGSVFMKGLNQAYVFPILDVILNIFNLGSQVFISWYLLKDQFGVLTTTLGLLSVLIIFGISIQTFVAREVSKHRLISKDIITIYNLVLTFMLAILIGLVILSKPISILLITDVSNLILVSLIVFINGLVSFKRGVLQGYKDLIYLNLSFYIEVLVKLVVIAIVLPFIPRLQVVYIATGVGMLAAYINDTYWLRRKHGIYERSYKLESISSVGSQISEVFTKVKDIAASNFGLFYLTSINMIIVNYFNHSLSGDYAVAIKYSQLVIFIGFSIITVIIPYASSSSNDMKSIKTYVLRFYILFFALGVVGLGVYKFIAPNTISLLFGDKYLGSGKYIMGQSISYILLIYCFLSISLYIAFDRKDYVYILMVGGAFITLGMIIFRSSIEGIIRVQIVSYLGLFILLTGKLIYRSDFMKTNKSRILFLSWRDIKSPKKGGAEVFTHQMLKNIDKEKFEITHFSPIYSGLPAEETIDGVKYIRKGNIFTVIPYAIIHYITRRKSIDYVVDQCNTHRFFTPLWVSRSKRIFFIHQMTKEIWFRNTKAPFSYIGYYFEKLMTYIYKGNRTFTVSNSTKKDLIDMGLNSSKILILPEGIDFVPWDKKGFLEKERDITFTYVGRFSKYKGIDATIESFGMIKRDHPDAKLWIIGKKDQRYIDEVLIPIMNSYNLIEMDGAGSGDVKFFGFVSDELKLELMSRSHYLVFPSEREGWGLTITEAAAVGTPSIVYNSAGLVDAVEGGNRGYIVSENTAVGLYKMMSHVVGENVEYEYMRDMAHEYSKRFQWIRTAEVFEGYMESIMKGEL